MGQISYLVPPQPRTKLEEDLTLPPILPHPHPRPQSLTPLFQVFHYMYRGRTKKRVPRHILQVRTSVFHWAFPSAKKRAK